MVKCRRLTAQEQQEWDNLQTDQERQSFVDRINIDQADSFDRVDLKSILRDRIGSNTPDLMYREGEKMPRMATLDIEEQLLHDALEANPSIKAKLNVNQAFESALTLTGETITKFQTELNQAQEELDNSGENPELEASIKDKIKQLKKISQEAGFPSSDLIAKSWSDFTSTEKNRLALSLVVDHSLDAGVADQFRDKALVFSSMSRLSGQPFLQLHMRIEKGRDFSFRLQDEYLRRLTDNPRWSKITKDNEKMKKVDQIYNSRDPESGVTVDPPVTEEDFLMHEIADEMDNTYKEWKPFIRFMRFYESYEDNQETESIQKNIPDASIEDIQEAKDILEGNGGLGTDNGENALWTYLASKTWGVINSIYDPRRVSNPKLKVDRQPLGATRGKSHLMPRLTDKMPWNQFENSIQRYDSYNLSMALRYYLRREILNLSLAHQASYDKWTDPEHIDAYLTQYLKAIQGYPDESYNMVQALGAKFQKTASPVIFMRPYVGLRNRVQSFVNFPYRGEIARAKIEYRKLPLVLRQESEEVFTNIVDQSGRALRDWMFQDEIINVFGELPLGVKKAVKIAGYIAKPTDFLARQAGRIHMMAVSDKATRNDTFRAGVVKASRATEQYKQDHDIQKWWDNSGINSGYITKEQQNILLGYFALGEETTSWGIPGLLEVSGYDSTIISIAKENTDRTLYLYDKAMAASLHSGSGRGLTSLLTYPRSSIQMYAMQVAKALDKSSSKLEKITAIKNIALLVLVGSLVGSGLNMVSGRRRKEYSILNTFTWSFGGLGFGVASDAVEAVIDIVTASAGTEEEKKGVLTRLPSQLARLGDTLVGFSYLVFDAIDLITETEGIDIYFFRKVRAIIDKNYTPKELEKIDRTFVEKLQKAIFSTKTVEPDYFEQQQTKLFDDEQRLGEVGLDGNSYTVKQYSQSVSTMKEDMPDWLITEEAGWTKLAMFAAHSEDMLQEYYTLPSQPTEIRSNWRRSHPEEEAMMMFWGKFDKSLYVKGSKEGTELLGLLNIWWDMFGLTPEKRAKATWLDGGRLAP